MNEISLFSVNTVTHCIHMRAHTQIPCICINKIHVQACACIYIWSMRESLQIRSVSERVANCMDIVYFLLAGFEHEVRYLKKKSKTITCK